ncbi:MAG: hypothetical protein HY681_13925 [Chloroflexi bacterium]|nr:hypothetical protein [Chloroflexota bacterium]
MPVVKGEGPGGSSAPKLGSGKRSWAASLSWATLLVAVAIGLSVTINPLLGRRVHWDWTLPLALALFAVLSLALRRRWM